MQGHSCRAIHAGLCRSRGLLYSKQQNASLNLTDMAIWEYQPHALFALFGHSDVVIIAARAEAKNPLSVGLVDGVI